MVVSDNEPSTKRRRCLVGEERTLEHSPQQQEEEEGQHQQEQHPEDVVVVQQSVASKPPPAAAVAPAAAHTKNNCTVFIGGLHPRITQTHVEKMCMSHGTIVRLHLIERKGYAFCQYARPSEAAAAMQALDGRGLLGRRLLVRPAHSDQQQQHGGSGLGAGSNSNNADNTSSLSMAKGNPDKERARIDACIQAVKRKLQGTNK